MKEYLAKEGWDCSQVPWTTYGDGLEKRSPQWSLGCSIFCIALEKIVQFYRYFFFLMYFCRVEAHQESSRIVRS